MADGAGDGDERDTFADAATVDVGCDTALVKGKVGLGNAGRIRGEDAGEGARVSCLVGLRITVVGEEAAAAVVDVVAAAAVAVATAAVAAATVETVVGVAEVVAVGKAVGTAVDVVENEPPFVLADCIDEVGVAAVAPVGALLASNTEARFQH